MFTDQEPRKNRGTDFRPTDLPDGSMFKNGKARKGRDGSDGRLAAILSTGRMVYWELNTRTGMVTRSANAEAMLGNCHEHVSAFASRVHPEDKAHIAWQSSAAPKAPPAGTEFRYRHPNGTRLWLRTTAVDTSLLECSGLIVGITADITEQKLAARKLLRIATCDELTGLLNRSAWNQQIEHHLEAATAAGESLLLMLVDVDFFKSINDSLDQSAGDVVLTSVGRRLQTFAADIRVAARLGGDEFALLLKQSECVGSDLLAETLLTKLRQPIRLDGCQMVIGASIGMATFPDQATTAVDLVKHAGLALCAAKTAGRDRFQTFEPAMRSAREKQTSLEAEFRAALHNGEIVPFYQPKIDLTTGHLVGFEALARWIHPQRGVLTPGYFGSLLEDGRISVEIGTVMRRSVLQHVHQWLGAGLPVGRVAVNFASNEFMIGDLASTLLEELDRFGVPAAHFELEITEGVVLGQEIERVQKTLTRLRAAGVKISLDDFGTGYASLIHLKRFSIDEIKIDRSFVCDIDKEPNGAIVQAILAMGRSLGLTTVAEGVETEEQANKLFSMGCTQVQGYLFGKPMSESRVPWFIRKGPRLRHLAKHAQAG